MKEERERISFAVPNSVNWVTRTEIRIRIRNGGMRNREMLRSALRSRGRCGVIVCLLAANFFEADTVGFDPEEPCDCGTNDRCTGEHQQEILRSETFEQKGK